MALALASAAVACGPEFPNSYYAMPERELLRAPEGSFEQEITRIAADVRLRFNKVAADERPMIQVELADLRRALAAEGVAATRARVIVENYERFRRELDAWTEKRDRRPRNEETEDFTTALPEGLSAEIAGYLRGAVAWRRGDNREAETQWLAVLELPAEARRYRTTWAAYMLGTLHLREADHRANYERVEAEQAALWFTKTRSYQDEGFADSLGLARASIGWEARAKLLQRDYVGAIDLYLQQHALGDKTALESLRITASRAAGRYEKDLTSLAKDPQARRVMTAYYISRFARPLNPSEPSERLQSWALVLREAGVKSVPDAERLAWLAYDAGLFTLAWEWIALASETVPEAQWLRAKLALRSGDLWRGEQLLRAALDGGELNAEHHARVAAELSRVCLARDDFAGALSASLQGEHWEDAAFVAERILTVSELKRVVDEMPPSRSKSPSSSFGVDDVRTWPKDDLAGALRHLLARRLARLGKGEEATSYFPEAYQSTYAEYLSGVQLGFDPKAPVEQRAAGFWQAAQIARKRGMELLGTELEPDWAIWGGAYELTESTARRGPRLPSPDKWGYYRGRYEKQPDREQRSLFLPTALESKRMDDQPAPEKRYHYCYRAAELAGLAASLLPNESEETAKILATAGGWLKARDPQAAKPFYQALVIRCGTTEIGRKATEAKWFPKPPSTDHAVP